MHKNYNEFNIFFADWSGLYNLNLQTYQFQIFDYFLLIRWYFTITLHIIYIQFQCGKNFICRWRIKIPPTQHKFIALNAYLSLLRNKLESFVFIQKQSYLFIYPPIYLSIHIFIYLSIYLFSYLFIYQSIYLFIYPSIYFIIYLFISLSIYSFHYLSIHFIIYLYISLSIYSFFYLSIYLSIYILTCITLKERLSSLRLVSPSKELSLKTI